ELEERELVVLRLERRDAELLVGDAPPGLPLDGGVELLLRVVEPPLVDRAPGLGDEELGAAPPLVRGERLHALERGDRLRLVAARVGDARARSLPGVVPVLVGDGRERLPGRLEVARRGADLGGGEAHLLRARVLVARLLDRGARRLRAAGGEAGE